MMHSVNSYSVFRCFKKAVICW